MTTGDRSVGQLFTVAPLLEAHEAQYRDYLHSLGLSPKTIYYYARSWRLAYEWCWERGHDLASAPPTVVAEYTFTTPATPGVRMHLRTALLRYWEMVGRDDPPRRAVKVPAQQRGDCRALSVPDAAVLAEVALDPSNGREGLALGFGLFLGLRVSEIAAAEWSRFDQPLEWYRVFGKFQRTHLVPVAGVFADRLAAHPGPHVGYLFTGYRHREYVHPATVWGWCKRLAAEAGVGDITTHQLRHTAIATVNDSTRDLRMAQEFAGHTRPETTAIYTRVTRERLRSAADALTEAYARGRQQLTSTPLASVPDSG